MLRSRLGRSALALALLAALIALGAIAWVVVRGHFARGLERADKTRVQRPPESGTSLSTESQPLEARSAEKSEASVASTTSGSGTLRIRVLDEKTREPVPDLGFLVYRERGGEKELGRGRTDAQGRAELREVEANTVIVRTERKPPYAEQTGAVWLKPGATKELELLVGAGGAIVGRVIDDLEQPIADAKIMFNDCGDVPSGPDGRFRFEHLASRPESVWIVDGGMRPESWQQLSFNVTNGTDWKLFSATPVPGTDVDVGDIRLDRATTFAGHLLDADGQLVAGAELTVSGSAPRPGETVTDELGRFEVRAAPEFAIVRVRTREGLEQGLRLPQAKPGARVEGVELRLRPETAFELELVDGSGAPAVVPARSAASPGVMTSWRGGGERSRQLSLRARTSDGADVRVVRDAPDPDGKWRARLEIDPRTIGDFEVSAAGYAPILECTANGLPPLVQRKLALESFPTLRVRLVCKESAKVPEGEGVRVQVQVCMADPAHHVLAGGRCCGFGSSWLDLWKGEPLDLVLPVRRNAAFWIYARGPRVDGRASSLTGIAYVGEMRPSGGLADVACIGPFEPGPDARELALDPANFAATRGGELRKPPEPSAPGGLPHSNVRVHVVDARTGKPLASASLELDRSNLNADENGDVKVDLALAGNFPFRVLAHGYELVDLGERTLRDRETLDLGTIALEPRLRHQGRVLDANGAPLPRVWLGIVSSGPASQGENSGLGAQADGSFDLLGDLGSSFVLQVVVPALHEGIGAETMRFQLEPWPADEIKEIRLPRCRKVVVTVGGTDPQESQLVPYVCPAPGEGTATCDHTNGSVRMHAELGRGTPIASSSQGQRYAFLLAPGRYVFWGSSLIHELPLTELEVAPGDGDLELTITAR